MDAKQAQALTTKANGLKAKSRTADVNAALEKIYQDIEVAANDGISTLEYEWKAWGTMYKGNTTQKDLFPSLADVTLYYSGIDGRVPVKRGDYPEGDHLLDALKAKGFTAYMSDGSLKIFW